MRKQYCKQTQKKGHKDMIPPPNLVHRLEKNQWRRLSSNTVENLASLLKTAVS